MEAIKRYFRKWAVIAVVGLLIVFFVVEVGAMKSPEAKQQHELQETFMSDDDAIAQQVKNLKPREFFIYQGGTADGIVVPLLVLQKSITMNAMVEDMGAESGQIAIPIMTCPIATIQLVFDALTNNSIDVSNFSLEKLVEIANAFTFFDVPQELLKSVVVQIKTWMESNSEKTIVGNEALKQLNPDLQKVLMIEPAITYLKDSIIKKYAQDRKKVLIGNQIGVLSVAFSPDGTKIVSGDVGNNLILWDISNLNNIIHQLLTGHPNSVWSVAFSPDGTKIVSASDGNQNNLILWDISNLNAITHQQLVGHLDSVHSVAFSPDGTKIVSGGNGDDQNNLILWDISNLNNITHQQLVGHPNSVYSVAFSRDGKNIVSGCSGGKNNLIVWNISNLNNITHQQIGHTEGVLSVAFSPDSTKIVSGGNGDDQNNLILWDISNLNNITHQQLLGHPGPVWSVAFNRDGSKIGSGCYGKQNNLILWDISNPHAITHQQLAGHSDTVRAVALSSNDKYIVSGARGDQNNLILWPLLTDQEEALLNQLKNNYTADQVRLVYLLCLQALKGHSIALKQGSEEQQIFMTLPQDMQKLLTALFDM